MIQEAVDSDFELILAGRAPAGLRPPDAPLAESEILAMLRELANDIRPYFAPASWMIISDGQLIGLCSLVQSPTEDAISIGYGIAEPHRSRGHASSAVAELLNWARGDGRIKTCNAETSIDNLASAHVLESNGFVQTGSRTDIEDGEMLCWAISVET